MPEEVLVHSGSRARLGLDEEKWAEAARTLAERFTQTVHLFG